MTKFNSRSSRIFEYTATKVMRQLFASVEVDTDGIKRVLSIAKSEKVPLILLPTHKSHIDYVILALIAFKYNIPLPYIAAGKLIILFFFLCFFKSENNLLTIIIGGKKIK